MEKIERVKEYKIKQYDQSKENMNEEVNEKESDLIEIRKKHEKLILNHIKAIIKQRYKYDNLIKNYKVKESKTTKKKIEETENIIDILHEELDGLNGYYETKTNEYNKILIQQGNLKNIS